MKFEKEILSLQQLASSDYSEFEKKILSRIIDVFEHSQVSAYLKRIGINNRKGIQIAQNFMVTIAAIEFLKEVPSRELNIIINILDLMHETTLSGLERQSKQNKVSSTIISKNSKDLLEVIKGYQLLGLDEELSSFGIDAAFIAKLVFIQKSSSEQAFKFKNILDAAFLLESSNKNLKIGTIKYEAIDRIEPIFSNDNQKLTDEVVCSIYQCLFDDDSINVDQIRTNRSEKKAR